MEFEDKMIGSSGVDMFVGEIGIFGCITFNEPDSLLASRTRQITLTKDTRIANSIFLENDINKVPKRQLQLVQELLWMRMK